jgi:hypothetical protein
MFTHRSRMTISQPDAGRLTVQSSMTRRGLFGGIGLLLVISFVIGMNWDEGIAEEMVVGTIFYFAITAVCLVVAGWNAKLVLDRGAGEARFIRSLFGIPVRSAALRLSEVTAVVIRGIRFLKESEQPRGDFSTRIQGYVERRNVYYKLHLETQDRLHLVEDSTNLADLEEVARRMAAFLGISFRREEL